VSTDLSLEQQVALLPKDAQDALLDALSDEQLEDLPYDWKWNGRPSQILPVGPMGEAEYEWELGLLNAGRGWGKTLAGSQYIREIDKKWHTLGRDPGQQLRVALLGRTAADVRDTILNGQSGLLNIYPPSEQDQIEWISTQRRVNLPGGGFALCFSAEEPDQLRGPQFHVGWGDEIAAYKQVKGQGELDAWTNLRIATRLGLLPQLIATTTPKRVPILRALLAEIAENVGKMLLRTGKTTDNVKLSQSYLNTLFSLYGGTTLGAQELEGLMLDSVEGATVDMETIDAHRVTGLPKLEGKRWVKIISVDPSVAEKPNDECGIVVIYAPLTMPILNRHAYVVSDLSLKASPTVWGDRVVKAAHKHGATVIVENNQGGSLVRRVLKECAAAANVPPPQIREVWSTKAKAIRAEPVGAAYERGRVHHLHSLPDLEDQLTTWTPTDSGYSPDRLDAVVHGLSALLFPQALVKGGVPGASSHLSPVGTRIDARSQLTRGVTAPRTQLGAAAAARRPGIGGFGNFGTTLTVPRRTTR